MKDSRSQARSQRCCTRQRQRLGRIVHAPRGKARTFLAFGQGGQTRQFGLDELLAHRAQLQAQATARLVFARQVGAPRAPALGKGAHDHARITKATARIALQHAFHQVGHVCRQARTARTTRLEVVLLRKPRMKGARIDFVRRPPTRQHRAQGKHIRSGSHLGLEQNLGRNVEGRT